MEGREEAVKEGEREGRGDGGRKGIMPEGLPGAM